MSKNKKHTWDKKETCQCGKVGKNFYPFFDQSNGLAMLFLCPDCFKIVNHRAKDILKIVKIVSWAVHFGDFILTENTEGNKN